MTLFDYHVNLGRMEQNILMVNVHDIGVYFAFCVICESVGKITTGEMIFTLYKSSLHRVMIP